MACGSCASILSLVGGLVYSAVKKQADGGGTHGDVTINIVNNGPGNIIINNYYYNQSRT